MGIGTSDGEFFEDKLTMQIADVDKRSEKERRDQYEMNFNSRSGDFQSRFGGAEQRPLVYIQPTPDIPSTQPPSTTPTQQSSTASTMPPGGSTEPAGAFKSQEGTPPTPDYLNPPEGNIIQKWMKGREDAIRNLPQTIRDIPENFMKDMKSSEGKTWDQRTEEAINVAGSFGTGTIAGVRSRGLKFNESRIVNDKGDEILASRRNLLGEAQVMEGQGQLSDTIWLRTGWGRGADGRWRYEIDDSKAVFNKEWADNPTPTEKQTGMKMRMLPEVLDHPELYDSYPQLKNVQVIYDHHFDGYAQWDGAAITMGKSAFKNQGILQHEIQHAVQDIEGFAKGGAAIKDPSYLKYTSDFEKLKPEMDALIKKIDDPKADWTAKDAERAQYFHHLAGKYREYTEEAYLEAHRYYERLAGEVEARNVDTRLLLTEAERRRMPLQWTEDTTRSQQIVSDKPVATTAYGVNIDGKYVKPKSEVNLHSSPPYMNVLGDLYNKITGNTKITEVSGDKDNNYPSQEDAKNAIKYNFGHGSGNEAYINAERASVKIEGLIGDLHKMIGSKAENRDLTKLTNIGDRAKIATLYAQGALAANRSAIATLGFDPRSTDLSTFGPLTIAGATERDGSKMWVNVDGSEKPSTIVHESIHKGLIELRKNPEAKELLKKLPDDEYVVRYMMATKMGNPEEGKGDIADKQRKTALSLFGLDSRFGKYVDRLEEIAAELKKEKRPGGPR